jgi:hypothetical protein
MQMIWNHCESGYEMLSKAGLPKRLGRQFTNTMSTVTEAAAPDGLRRIPLRRYLGLRKTFYNPEVRIIRYL